MRVNIDSTIRFLSWKFVCKVSLILIVTLSISYGWNAPAIAQPVTPSTVQYELERSKNPEEVGQKLQEQSQEYKKELAKSPKPIPNAAKNVKDKTQALVEKTGDRVQETLNQESAESPQR